ncbi:unnamed protein product [Effrenium voratum]|nr:unnamed protein product [Effrenium voratum]
MADRRSQAQRVVEYHQAHIADHLLRCAGAGNEKPFRHTLSNSVEPTRRPSPFQQQREYLLSGEKPRHGKEVQPVLRLRQPRGGRSCPPSILGAAGATAARISPRLPPLVYEGIDSSLAGQRLPAAWFAEPPPLEAGWGLAPEALRLAI